MINKVLIVLFTLMLGSCSLLTEKKYMPTKKGVRSAIKNKIKDIDFCSKDRLSTHINNSYFIKVNFLIDKNGELSKLNISSKPQISYGVDNCLRDILEELKFYKPKNEKAVRIYSGFKLKSLQ